jgi:hypothetical protein
LHTGKLADDLWDLAVAETIWSSLLLFHHSLQPDVKNWSADNGQDKCQHYEKPDEQQDDHENEPSAGVFVLLAIIVVREINCVAIDDPDHKNRCKQDPGENIKVNSIFVVSSQDPNNV